MNFLTLLGITIGGFVGLGITLNILAELIIYFGGGERPKTKRYKPPW